MAAAVPKHAISAIVRGVLALIIIERIFASIETILYQRRFDPTTFPESSTVVVKNASPPPM
jgi:hypothetical protein